ncbi:MAG: tetratricopeptide repeat protein [Pyrinomonadaceae bacterium]
MTSQTIPSTLETVYDSRRRHLASLFVSMLLLAGLAFFSAPTRIYAQAATANDEAERQRALKLYTDGNWVEALPLFEKLAVSHPSDAAIIEGLGFMVISNSMHLKDAEERKRERVRGRAFLARAKELGSHHALLEATLEEIPPDGGGELTFSKRKDVDEAILEGEEAFKRREYAKAVTAYERALRLDPQQYDAALYAGDAYFQLNDPVKAGEWYARAISIDPDRETAYRYWGDVLMKQGKMPEARDKFVEAYISEPYSRLTQAAFSQWAEKNKTQLAHPRIDIPNNVSSSKPGEVTITIDSLMLDKSKDDTGSIAWFSYGIERALWMKNKDGQLSEKFSKQYPNEKTYRHSLAEEADALGLVMISLKGQMKEKKIKRLDPSLANLLKLGDAGLIEPYILLARPDQGIAQDFAAYRKANRDKLRRYVVEYILTGGGQ